jgi:hypothetical protein
VTFEYVDIGGRGLVEGKEMMVQVENDGKTD